MVRATTRLFGLAVGAIAACWLPGQVCADNWLNPPASLPGRATPSADADDVSSPPWLKPPASLQADPAGTSPATSASYLQYEPQNVPLADDLQETAPPLPLPASPQSAVAATAQPPWIVPYGTQFLASWTSGSGDQLGMTDLDLRQTLVFPRKPGFMISPGSSFHFLSGPETTDLPENLYDHWIEFRWLKKLNDRWAFDLAVTPSYFTDYENTSSDAVRITGRAIAMWTYTPELQLAMGVVYLDREDIVALPGVGAIWTPNDDYKVELLFPRPRILRKLASSTPEKTRWAYLAGEFGGGSWAIDRSNGTPDVFTYSALRLLVGYESKQKSGFAPRIEAGYIFNRKVEYQSGVGDFDPDDAVMLRVGGSF